MFDALGTDQGFSRYSSAIERYPVLDRERELALSSSYLRGDKAAGDLLVCCNLRYVVKIAHGYRGYGFRINELVAEGNMGLLQAVRRFEPDRGLRFMTYASYWVRAHVLSYILKHWSLVGVGTGPMQSKLFFRLHREKAKLAARLGTGEDLTAKLAETFGTTEDRIRSMEQRIDARDSSLDAKAFRDGTTTVMDTLTDEGASQEAALMSEEVQSIVHERVADALTRLDEREQVIVHHRLIGGERQTLSEIGKTLGLSRERVRQLEQRVKTKLRRSLADLAPEGATYAEAA
ncbi:MAG: RNA polymerase factor sigma-32 [Deltaproteobacteria bacterium]|nr:RNA polymerase factor sigma-32 [Nannocystaceae bacterium]